jgi:hypothetical protein
VDLYEVQNEKSNEKRKVHKPTPLHSLREREFKTSSQFIMRQMLPYASLLLLPLPPSFSLPFLAMTLLTALL